MAIFAPATSNDDSTRTTTGIDLTGNLCFGIGPRHAYVRFPNITIVKGSTILSAKITFVAAVSYSEANTNVKISANASDDSVAPTTHMAFDALSLSTANVEWNNIEAWTGGSPYDSPDITEVIQEIVDRSGWTSGNAIGIVIKDNGSVASLRQARSYDYGSMCPVLTITWSDSFNKAVSEDFTVNAAMDAWKTPDELAEGFTINATMKAGFETEGTLSEDLTVNAAMSVEKETGAPIFENLTVNASMDAIATYNRGLAASASVADSIDALATYNRGLESTVNLGAVMDAEFKWPVKRQVFPYRAQGKRLSIRIGCAQKGSWIRLLDISTTVLPMVGRTRSQAVKLKGIGNHIGVKIGNTDGGTLKLAYAGLQIGRPIGR